jgi:hypothetical protein
MLRYVTHVKTPLLDLCKSLKNDFGKKTEYTILHEISRWLRWDSSYLHSLKEMNVVKHHKRIHLSFKASLRLNFLSSRK